MSRHDCWVCNSPLKRQESATAGDFSRYECERCGLYELSGTLERAYRDLHGESDLASANLSHEIRWASKNGEPLRVTSYLLDASRERGLTPIDEQMDNLLRWTAASIKGPGHHFEANDFAGPSITGALDHYGYRFVVDALEQAGLVTAIETSSEISISPTASGWIRVSELERGLSSGRRAFVAMQFGEQDLDDLFDGCFAPACRATGFQAIRLDREPEAGLIDIRMRVEIQRARFVIADLTHTNAGAYWEAGYADGLGKPVIYSCRKDQFDERRVHFDTRNHYTLVWESSNLPMYAEKLADVVRATLPELAKNR